MHIVSLDDIQSNEYSKPLYVTTDDMSYFPYLNQKVASPPYLMHFAFIEYHLIMHE